MKADHDFCAQESELRRNAKVTHSIEDLVRDIHATTVGRTDVDRRP
ncbi:hypothetical protein [Nocardioides aurantiacus]